MCGKRAKWRLRYDKTGWFKFHEIPSHPHLIRGSRELRWPILFLSRNRCSVSIPFKLARSGPHLTIWTIWIIWRLPSNLPGQWSAVVKEMLQLTHRGWLLRHLRPGRRASQNSLQVNCQETGQGFPYLLGKNMEESWFDYQCFACIFSSIERSVTLCNNEATKVWAYGPAGPWRGTS